MIFQDGSELSPVVPFGQHADSPAQPGVAFTTPRHIRTDDLQKTGVPGLWACGDNASPIRTVVNAAAKRSLAGAMANSAGSAWPR